MSNKKSNKITEILFIAAFPVIGVVIPLIIHIISFEPVLTEEIAGMIVAVNAGSASPFPMGTFLRIFMKDISAWQSGLFTASIAVYVLFALIYIVCACLVYIFVLSRFLSSDLGTAPSSRKDLTEAKKSPQKRILSTVHLPGKKQLIILAGIIVLGLLIGYYAVVGPLNRSYSATALPLVPHKELTDLTPSVTPICEELEKEYQTSTLTTAPITNTIKVLSDGRINAIYIYTPDEAGAALMSGSNSADTELAESSEKTGSSPAATLDDAENLYVIYDPATLDNYKSSPRIRFADRLIEQPDLSLFSYKTASFLTDDDLLTDLSKISGKKYSSYLLSTYDISEFDPKIFKGYTLKETFLSAREMDKKDSLTCLEYYNGIIFDNQKIEDYYFGVDPVIIWDMCGADEKSFEDFINETINTPSLENPEVNFELILPGYSISRPTTSEDAQKTVEIYEKFTENLYHNENLHINYYGGKDWLCVNPYLFAEDSYIRLNDDIMEDVVADLLLGLYRTDAKGLISEATAYLDAAVKYTDDPPQKYDLENTTVVILGDSIFDHDRGCSNAGETIANLSGASVINLAIGGASAARSIYTDENPDEYTDILKNQLADTDSLKASIESAGNSDLIFIFEFGLNDYFEAGRTMNPDDPFDEYTYSGAIMSGIKRVKEAYPGCACVVITPGMIGISDNGEAPYQEGGEPLQSYREALKNAVSSGASGTDIYVFDIVSELNETEENIDQLLKDKVHFSRYGRFLLGRALTRFLADISG